MTRPIFLNLAPSTANTTYFAASVSGASFTLTNNTTPDGLAHQVTIIGLSATDLSGINVTLIGIGQDGNSQTETFALPNGIATVTSALYYQSLTSATPASTTGAAAVKIGFNNVVSSRTIPACWRGSLPFVRVFVTGTINYSVQYTGDNIQGGPNIPPDPRPYNWQEDDGTQIVAATTTGAETFTSTPIAFRLLINSYSAGAIAKMTISQMNPYG